MKIYALIVGSCLFILIGFWLASSLQVIREGAILSVTIEADGSILPSFSPVSTRDNVTYFLTDDIFSDTVGIVIERSNIIFEGNNHSVLAISNGTGLALIYVKNVTVRNLIIKGFDFGLVLGYTSESTLSNNNVTSRFEGISLTFSFFNNVSCNSIANNSEYGIELKNSCGNLLSGNEFAGNRGGVLMILSSNNTWTGNRFISNTEGVRIDYSSNNSFFRNNFLNNKWQIDNFDTPESKNVWDNGSEGNYWSDYTGKDSNHDGIGDIPYIIDPNNIDHHPFIAPVCGN